MHRGSERHTWLWDEPWLAGEFATHRDRVLQADDCDDATLGIWGSDVADLEAEHVRAALHPLRRTGHEFPPNGGQLRAAALRLT